MKYRSKPKLFDATQWHPGCNMEGVNEIHGYENRPYGYLKEADHLVEDGDWILTDELGNRRVCRDKVFQENYEPMEAIT